ncbi:bifunctional phosphoribosylaminoimidazolecarboxamide formyltransferase/inosine monophosphate cyclohydrolase [Halobacillus halophilus]|uniref:Bifunctional purine biosynthesis protein PurH n=1 Tax=Halobacillus halophilus (strain ATCC 35676 / DSM 2266 / JCM 20832 / KCTC 3685 / LMG 17431 / NBRC 102448 / NCIMB 2269) TaxID=866895 RepID=I0JIJ9_HALH3|nr:bifunctional phosphoribosylaminoimidazolecarboxamide formyltransferase/IMP cyclohydrolase [Halobacillus halophilus]ASF38150.1 bifunctional phosphoribosylaminoimidazolecarboxamide formyltransferase/inosine monophosphate cyclohydrolase [Halobacillus halophilus]CCG43967.1 bifunctional phosphoribosylaminoimidazolecarboxamide formyltransferase / IMP cyclohydrolase [Halobacillus halophilus DSM 2266]
MKKRALLSVSNKQGLTEFAKQLHELDYELISTGGTKRTIEEAGIPVLSISEITDFPEIMDGRVKTLHPAVHGGLLAKRGNEDHMQQLDELNIQTIDLVAVNLYPFKDTIAKPGVTDADAIENVDIGGPTMLRAAAKSFEDVAVVVNPADYDEVIAGLQDELTYEKRRNLAAKVFRHTANYDAMIAEYFTTKTEESYPETYTATYEKVQSLRYGENPHQSASFYKKANYEGASLAQAEQLNGKELSYNNIQDANAALEVVLEFEQPAAVAVKHMNPCGVGVGENIYDAYVKAYEGDPVSIFGGIVALNREVDEATAAKLKEIFLEIIIAPSFSQEALDLLTKKKNLRLLTVEMKKAEQQTHKLTSVSGGLLVQDTDEGSVDVTELEVATSRKPTDQELHDLKLGWKVVKHVKSNAIVIAKGDRTLGVGAGQMNRVGAAKIALEQADEQAKGSIMASDAFFPMPDTVEAAAEAGVTAIIQPGGSKRDQDSIDACDKHGIAMVFTRMRHFKH